MDRGVWTVTRFEIGNYLKKKGWINSTVLVMVLIALLLSLPSIIALIRGDQKDEVQTPPTNAQQVVVVDHVGAIHDLSVFQNVYRDKLWSKEDVSMLDNLRERAKKGEIYGILEILPDKKLRLILSKDSMTDGFISTVADVADRVLNASELSKAGLPPETIEKVMRPATLDVQALSASGDKSIEETYWQTYVIIFLFYMMILMYGQFIAQSVAKEKGNRSMEMLITSTKSLNLIVGKVLGATAVAVLQVVLYIVTFAVFYQINKASLSSLDFLSSVLQMPVSTVLLMLVFFTFGLLSFAFIYGALGSLVSRMEDIGTTSGGLTFLFIFIFIASILAMMNPSETWVKVLSYLPLFSPMIFFVRTSMTTVMWWEVLLAIASQVATMVFFAWLSARIYRIGVLMYGQPPKFREVIAMLKKDRLQRKAIKTA